MEFENWMKQRYSSEYRSGEYRDHDMKAAYTAGFREASDKAATLPRRAMYDAGYEAGVQAERDRCSRIAKDVPSKRGPCSDMYESGYCEAQDDIAAAIKRQKNG